MIKSSFPILIIALVASSAAIRYCEVQDSTVNIFTPPNEVQQILLSKHFKGFNLNYQSSDPQVVDVYEPFHVAEEARLELRDGYLPINVDSRKSKDNLWGRDGIVLAQASPSQIAVGYGAFKNDVLPAISNFTYFTLPKQAYCYSGHIFDYSSSVIVDCELSTHQQDLLCLLRNDGSQQCSTYDVITHTGKRINMIHSIDSNQYLFSAADTAQINPSFQNQTFINIYHIRDSRADFNLIVDRRTLGLDSLSITDMSVVDIHGVSYIMISDASGKLIMFRYMPDNTIGDIKVLNVEDFPQEISITPNNEIIVGTPRNILTYSLDMSEPISLKLDKRYQVDPSDNYIVDIQSSISHITVRTGSSNIYTYDRRQTALKFLLNKEKVDPYTSIVVSPFYPRTFHINGTHMKSVALTNGYLYISSVLEDKNVTISATSGNLTCKLNLVIKKVSDSNKIYNKKDIQTSYRFQNEDNLQITLNDYFGGKNLNYQLKNNGTKDISYEIKHFRHFTQSNLNIEDDIDLYRIVEIDENSYYFITFSIQGVRFWKCSASNSSINCQEDTDSMVPGNKQHIKLAESGTKEDGSQVLVWAYESPIMGYKVLGKRGFTWVMSYDSRYTSILVGKKFTCLVEKQMNRINFYDGERLYTFSPADFSQDQLDRMGGGFYPRDIYADQTNPNLFYIKFPVGLVQIAYLGKQQIEVLTRIEVSKSYVGDDRWSFVFGRQTLLFILDGQVKQFSILPDSTFQVLHQVQTDGDVILPATYQESTNSVFFGTNTGNLQYIKMNENSIESQYYKMKVPDIDSNGTDWSISESWLFLQSGDVYYQYKKPTLKVNTNVPQNMIKEDFNLDISVSNENDQEQVNSNLTVYNYASTIKSNQFKASVSLPQVGQSKIIDFPVQDYFTGSVASFTIDCPFSLDKSLTLVPPFQLIKDSETIQEFYDIESLPDNSGVLTLYNNAITLSSLDNKVINSFGIDSKLTCKWMDVNMDNIVVLCQGDSSQEIAWLKISSDSDISLKKISTLPSEALLQNPFEVGCYGNKDQVTVLLHDKQPNSYQTGSNVKLVVIADELDYKGTLDSTNFGLSTVEPMNSFSVMNKHVLVSIGGKGLGYMNLENLNSAQFIDLQSQAQISNFTLENSQFARVSIHSYNLNNGEMSVFLTTSNSLHYLINLNVGNNGATYGGVKQTYNKYGHQVPINWIAHNDQFVMMAYYNSTTYSESIVLYKRGTKGPINFMASSEFSNPSASLNPLKSILIDAKVIGQKSSLLFIAENTRPSSSAYLGLYNITGQYSLKAAYKQAGNFESIKVTAKNDYSTATKMIDVQFDGQQTGGLKWYSVLIVICLVLIAVGVAFGLYLKMKNRKADSKKVSLFTENEEVDEVI